MIHAFMLVVVMGTGEFRQIQPNAMIFRSIDVCQYYAKRIPRQYGNYSYNSYVDPKDRVTAYCKPVKVQDGPNIYDHQNAATAAAVDAELLSLVETGMVVEPPPPLDVTELFGALTTVVFPPFFI